MPKLNEKQLKQFQRYVSVTIQNNLEIHPSDMPPVITMFELLADRGLWVSEEQVDSVCDSLHSLSNREAKTSEILRDYLRHVASAFEFLVRHQDESRRYKRPYQDFAEDIVHERDIGL